MRRKNLFSIGRREGNENQLTEMLAYLLQEEDGLVGELLLALGLPARPGCHWEVETQRAIPSGFLDLVLDAPGEAFVIIESKLGSYTDYTQMAKYIEYAAELPVTGLRALVFTTQQPEPWPPGIPELAAARGVLLVAHRWQAVADALSVTRRQLAHDFVTMLAEEALVHPAALTPADWQTWREGNHISRTLAVLLDEADRQLQDVLPGFVRRRAVVKASNGHIFRSYEFAGVELSVGFWPSQRPSDPANHALVTIHAVRTDLSVADRKELGRATVANVGLPSVKLGGSSGAALCRDVPTHVVLTADSFVEQRDQLVAHVRDVLDFLAEVGYISTVAINHDIGEGQ
jgi:hypothetical protein